MITPGNWSLADKLIRSLQPDFDSLTRPAQGLVIGALLAHVEDLPFSLEATDAEFERDADELVRWLLDNVAQVDVLRTFAKEIVLQHSNWGVER